MQTLKEEHYVQVNSYKYGDDAQIRIYKNDFFLRHQLYGERIMGSYVFTLFNAWQYYKGFRVKLLLRLYAKY
jgi:hypothetical protein